MVSQAGLVDTARPVLSRLRRRLTAIRRPAQVASTPQVTPATETLATDAPGLDLSVVLDAYDAQAPFFDECLERLSGMGPNGLQIIVVLHGDSRTVREYALTVARKDSRVQVLEPAFDDAAAARNAGVAAARGRYLTFVRACDVVPAKAYEQLLTSLTQSESDFAVGRLAVRRGQPSSSRIDFATDTGQGKKLAELPTAISDTFLGNRMFRRTFFTEQGLKFHPGSDPDALEPAVHAYLAGTFDVIPGVVYTVNERALGRPFGWIRPQMPALTGWLDDLASATELVDDTGSDELATVWRLSVLDGSLLPFIDDVEAATDEQWVQLRQLVTRFTDELAEEGRRQVRAETKVKLWLVRNDRRSALEDFLAQRWYVKPHLESRMMDNRCYALLPYFEDDRVGIPHDCFALADSELPMVVSLRRAHWYAGRLRFEVWAFIRKLDLAEHQANLRVLLVDPSGAKQEVPGRQGKDPAVDRWANDKFQSYANGVFFFDLDPTRVSAIGNWQVQFELTVAGVCRRSGLTRVDPQGSAALLTARGHGDKRIRPIASASRGLVLEVSNAAATLLSVGVHRRTIKGTVRAGRNPLTGLIARTAAGDRSAELTGPSFCQTFSLDLGEPEVDPVSWLVRAITTNGAEVPIAWLADSKEHWVGPGPEASVLAIRTPAGNLNIQEVSGRFCIEGIDPGDDELVVTGRWLGQPAPDSRLVLRSSRLEIDGTEQAQYGVVNDFDRLKVVFPIRLDRWGMGESLLPSDRYQVAVLSGTSMTEPGTVPTWADEELIAKVPTDRIVVDYRCQLVKGSGASVEVIISAPLGDDVLSNYGQCQLQRGYAAIDGPLDERGVYFQCYDGRVATDTELALHQELRHRDEGHVLYWGIADHATVLPDGAVPLLLKSPEWYQKLAEVTYLVNNADFDRWFAKRPGQRFLQTFHGYPSKAMGIGFWKAKNFSPRRIAAERNRTCRHWDLATTPTPEMNRHYRSQYGYRGPLFDQGYARNDVLAGVEVGEIRQRVRRALGITEHQIAVLYAPTWRDDIATDYESAPLTSHLDLDQARADLGDDFVLLLRGHRFHTRSDWKPGVGATLVDVTDYPEVNDLILAADAGVFDYSSIRFDFALTGKPMIFLAPDLDSYGSGGRGFLFDFRSSAPGPMAVNSTEVITALHDLPKITAQYAEAYVAFNARFNQFQDGRAAARLVDAFFDQLIEGQEICSR